METNNVLSYGFQLTSAQVALLYQSSYNTCWDWRRWHDWRLRTVRKAENIIMESGWCTHRMHRGLYHTCSYGLVYLMRMGDAYKIGYTEREPLPKALNERLRSCERKYGFAGEFKFALYTYCARSLEEYIHWKLDEYRMHAAVISRSPELFLLDDSIVSDISSMSWFNGRRIVVKSRASFANAVDR